MFKELFKGFFTTATGGIPFKTIAVAILLAVLTGFGFYVKHLINTIESQKVKIANHSMILDIKDSAIKNLIKERDKEKEDKNAALKAVSDLAEEKNKNQEKKRNLTSRVDKSIKQIDASNLPKEQKVKLKSVVHVDAVFDAYCGATDTPCDPPVVIDTNTITTSTLQLLPERNNNE